MKSIHKFSKNVCIQVNNQKLRMYYRRARLIKYFRMLSECKTNTLNN